MKSTSVFDIIGPNMIGPSSSHTIGPEKACMIFKDRNKEAESFKAILYGSLAKTGKGHCTDEVIRKTFLPYKCALWRSRAPSGTSARHALRSRSRPAPCRR